MTIQPVKAFASFVDKTGSKTIDLCKNAKTKTLSLVQLFLQQALL